MTATDCVVGCDVGSQSTKAVLLSLGGSLVGEAVESYAVDFPRPLWAEQPVERWTAALGRAVSRLLQETGVTANRVRALAVASQVDGVVPIDASGRPLLPAILWMDRRAAAQCEAARAAWEQEDGFHRSGLNLDPSHVAPKIRWIAESQPKVNDRTAHFLLPGSYIAYHLTGEMAVDYSNASSTMLLDVRSRSWSSALCGCFQVDPARLAPLGAASAVLGTLRPAAAESLGLKPGTPVVIGCGDEHAACLGGGVLRPGLVGDIVGTAEPLCAFSPELLFDPGRLVETHCHADPASWLIENPGFVSGGNYRWYRDNFPSEAVSSALRQGANAYALLDAEAERVTPGAEGLVLLPCLMGAVTPTWNEAARGVFAGFTLAHSHAHFTRAILEGSAYAVRDITDRMRIIGLDPREIRVMGGGARSRLWNQIKADVTGIPVVVPYTTETTALGAALLALVGLGVDASLAEASNRVVQVRERIEPRTETREIYESLYALYRQTYAAMEPVFTEAARRPQQPDIPGGPPESKRSG
jgi:xylulokinase